MRQEETILSFKKKELDLVFSMKKSRQKKQKNKIKYNKKRKKEKQNPKTKSIIEFDQPLASIIKSLVKKNETKPITRFF